MKKKLQSNDPMMLSLASVLSYEIRGHIYMMINISSSWWPERVRLGYSDRVEVTAVY